MKHKGPTTGKVLAHRGEDSTTAAQLGLLRARTI
jgi:hypothetical protein